MVFESVAGVVLNKFLQRFFFGISSKNIQFTFLDGKFVLSNIGLQPSLITNLNLPIELRYSYVERVEIHVPWREQEVSFTVNISNIYVLVSDAGDNFDAKNIFMKGKEAVIQSALKEFKSNLERQNKKDYGFVQKLLLNLLDNVNIKIQCIHIRYQNKNKNYSFGIKVNEVSAKTVDHQDNPTFFNRQKSKQEYVRYILEMDFMGIYFNSKQESFLCNKTSAEITDEFNKMSNIRVTNIECVDYEENMDTFNYVLTISLKTHLKKFINPQKLTEAKEGKYLFQCDINLNKIESRVTHQQYYDILDLINIFTQYQKTYQQYANERHLINFREKRAKDILDLLHRKNKKSSLGKKEKEMLTMNCRKYLTWIFKHTYEEVLKRKFIKEAIKSQINTTNIKENKTLMRLMEKIQNDKLKHWILLSLYFRKKLQDRTNPLFRTGDRVQQFGKKYIDSVQFFLPHEFEDEINKMRETTVSQFQVFLKMNINIKQFTFEISKQSMFGVTFNLDMLKASLIVRQKNYQIKLSMQDFQANVFNCKKSQKFKTYVPIIKRNIIDEGIRQLLQIRYERNPLGKPFVFNEIQVLFESIEITIYPEAFKQFYQILLGDKETKSSKPKNKGKVQKQRVGQTVDQTVMRQFRFQKTIIKGKVKSPWIVLPLSTNNDMSKECWVVRLGDFFITTPQTSPSQREQQEQQLYYQKYRLEMKRFELNYFSSINFFHNWQKFNQNLQSLYKIKSFQKQKIITMISPFSCFVDFSNIRANLPQSIKSKKHRFISRISIDQINITISKFLLTKMKYRFDIFGEQRQQLNDFIETNINNLRQQNDLCGYCKVSYDKINKLNFYCVLKDNFMYFFLNENYHKYHFFVNLTEVAIRLISNQVEHFNRDKSKMIVFYLGQRQKHQHWRKKIMYLLSRKDRKIENSYTSSFRRNSAVKEERSPTIVRNSQMRSRDDEKEDQEQGQSSSTSMKMNMTFLMNKLSIKLLDEKDQEFLDCMFKKATFVYQVLRTKEMQFCLNQWIVNQTDKGEKFVSSHSFFEEQKEDESNANLTNFLQIKFIYNQIISELQSIVIQVDKLFLAWKVQLFTKILLYFFYEEEVGDAPSPSNPNKKRLQILIHFQQFTFYAYFVQELIALGKLQFIDLRYYQDSVQQIYDFKCKIFQMDKYVEGNRAHRLPMIKPRYKSQMDGVSYNNIDLYYYFRKKDTENEPNIQRLKKQLGDDILVSQIFCELKDSIIYFENQMTFRLFNYILNKILGTVTSKFKKRQFSPTYIFQALKTKKATVFDVKLRNFQFRMPPHERGFRQFNFQMEQMHVKKNIDDIFLPTEVQVPTIRYPLTFLWESMMFNITEAKVSYRVGQEPPIPLHKVPFDISFIYSKLNFQRQYYRILKHHDDIDRKAILDLIIEKPVVADMHKIMFVTFLQLFYQNIKHKDGKAEKYEPSLPFPSLRQYNIHLRKVGLNMCHYNQQENSMQPYSLTSVDDLKIEYKQVGSVSEISITGDTIFSEGELPIYNISQQKKKFAISMHSQEGEMKVVINAQYYALQVNLDNLNNIIQFINYDSDYVSNKLMQKKSSSWQYVNVFVKNCKLKLGQLHATGQFYISYLKGMRNQIQKEALNYLLSNQDLRDVKEDPSKLNWNDLTDKEIKVNGQDIQLSINGDHIGRASNLIFNRQEITAKSTNRKFKREKVQVGEGSLYIQLIDLKTIWGVYNSHIKKSSTFVLKTFYQPWDKLPPKEKTIQKRITEVQIQQLSISILPNLQVQKLVYIRIDLAFPLILYKTYLDEQEIQVNIRVALHHNKDKVKQVQIGGCRHFKLRYMHFKERKQKWIQILSAKNVRFLLHQINSHIIANLLEEATNLKESKRKFINYNSDMLLPVEYEVIFKNETASKVELSISDKVKLTCESGQVRHKSGQIEVILDLLNDPNSFITITEGNNPVKKNGKDVYLYEPTSFGTNVLMIIPETKVATFVYRPPFQIINKTSGLVLLFSDKKIVKTQQSVTFSPKGSYIDFQIKIGPWNQKCSVDVRKEHQIFGEGCFVSQVKKKQFDTIVELTDRFTIKNILPVSIQFKEREIPVNGQLSLGVLTMAQQKKIPIEVQSSIVFLDLVNQDKKRQYQKKIKENSKERQYQVARCQINIQYEVILSKMVISLWCQYCLKNQCERDIIYGWGKGDYVMGGKQSLIVPGSFSNLNFRDHDETIQMPKNKDKPFYSKYLQFRIFKRRQGKINILKIQPKYTCHNNSRQTIQIQKKNSQLVQIFPFQTYGLNFENIIQDKIIIIFGKYHRKQITLSHLGVNFLQMQQIFFRLSVVQKDQSVMIIIQDSKQSHLIMNKLNDITITASSSRHIGFLSGNGHKNMSEVQSEDNIMKLIKPGEQEEIGLVNWNNPVIELEFYYDAKNIEFKQKYAIDFSKIGPKYSIKHTLHEEKDNKFLFVVVLTFEKDSQGRYTVSAHKEKEYEGSSLQKMKFAVNEASCTFVFSNHTNNEVTIELFKLNLIRQKGIEIQDIDLQTEKLLIRQGKSTSILSALHQGKFLNCHLILNKTLRGTCINNLMLKITPLQLICREKSIFMILEKIVEVRGASNKKKSQNIKRFSLTEDTHNKEFWKSLQLGADTNDLNHNSLSIFKQAKPFEGRILQLDKDWEKELQKLIKGQKTLTVKNLQITETSVFVSYTKEEYRSFDDRTMNDPLIKYMLVIPPISELKLAIPHLKISQFQGESKAFAKQLVRRLRQSIGATIISSFSSLPLFDSPIIAADGIFKYIEGILSIQ